MSYVNQFTAQYTTFVKRAAVESLIAAFTNHPDPTVVRSKVGVDYQDDDFHLPAVIIKFKPTQHINAGVGHFEYLPSINNDGTYILYQHRIYKGTISFEVYGANSPDRDLLIDAISEVIGMDEASTPGQAFINRFYNQFATTPYGEWHFATLNTDLIEPSGEGTMMAPWRSEDELVYTNALQVPIMGEYYSYTPPEATSYGPIAEVDVYSYPVGADGITPIDPSKPKPPVSSDKYDKYTGFPTGQKTVPTG
jgi:hypothetical protein